MARRLVPVLLVVALSLAATAAAGDLSGNKQSLDARIAGLHDKIAQARAREQTLGSQIADVTARIKTLEAREVGVSQQLSSLESDLALHRAKLDRLTTLFRLETRRYEYLRRQYRLSVERLGARMVEAYESGNPDTIDVLAASSSFTDFLDQLDYLNEIAAQDGHVVSAVRTAKSEARRVRERTAQTRLVVAAETRTVAARAGQVRAVHDQLLAAGHQLSSARSSKRSSLVSLREQERRFVSEAAILERESAALAARIQSAETTSPYSPPSHVSSSGLIWPVNGPVVSPFGMRWGRLHTGIDIAVPYGTPIHASAAGRVIYAGWMGGYGNLVVIDHGRGLATAYAHQSSIAAGNGSVVAQGQVIGYVGCTGHCFGPHLHFEVRVNGQPVDPMGYL